MIRVVDEKGNVYWVPRDVLRKGSRRRKPAETHIHLHFHLHGLESILGKLGGRGGGDWLSYKSYEGYPDYDSGYPSAMMAAYPDSAVKTRSLKKQPPKAKKAKRRR